MNISKYRLICDNKGKGKRSRLLVFGHTHRSFYERGLANTGGWVTVENGKKSYVNSFLVIQDQKLELKRFDGENIVSLGELDKMIL